MDRRDNILSLHTNSFKTEECWELVNKIKKNFGNINANVIITKKIYPRINISRASYNNILNYIECPISCFNYKFTKKFLKKIKIKEGTVCR